MAVVDTPLQVSPAAQERIVKFVQDTCSALQNNWNLRTQLLEKDQAYYREQDRTEAQRRAEAANRNFDATKLQNVTVPVVQPQVDATHSYLVETFLSSYPIFPVASKPQLSEAAEQVDTVMGESAIEFQYARQLSMCFKDALKYNLVAAEVDWKNKKVYSVQNDAAKDVVFGVPVETYFSGNMLKRIDLYNIILDTRVAPCDVAAKGDFAGYSELMSRIQLKQLFLDLDTTNTMNATDAFQSGGANYTSVSDGTGAYYVPNVNPKAFNIEGGRFSATNWLAWAKLDTERQIQYSDLYEVITLYARIIPREFGIRVKNAGIPQIYKLIVVNRKVCIYCERMTNAHNLLPIIVAQGIEDGLNYQTKSFAENAIPYQQLASALYTSGIQSQRRKVYDRIFYDPSRINKADIDRVDPVARIAVKSEAYGKPIGDAFAVVPYRDEGVATILQMGREVTQMADIAVGQNRVQQGQFQKGNKTRQEFDTVMDKSDSRSRTMALILETTFLQPIKQILKFNILQYQPPVELYNRAEDKLVKVDPGKLRQLAWQFQVADGVLPVSKLINFEVFGQVMQFAQSQPMFAMEYDLLGMYVYTLQLQGASWVKNFKRTPEQMAQLQGQINGNAAKPAAAPAGPSAA